MADVADPQQMGPLTEDVSCDVCVVGAGIAGLTVAYTLTRQGHKVVVVDDGPVGGGETGRTTAHLSNALDDRYYELERLFGEAGAKLAAESHTAAINYIEHIVSSEGIDCDFTYLDGYLFNGDDEDKLQDERHAAHRAGLTGVEFVGRAPINDFNTGPALRFPGQAQFHPLKYLSALARIIQRDGARIFTNTRANDFKGGENATVGTERGPKVHCKQIVVCTNTPVNDMVTMHTKQMPYRTYVVAFRIRKDSVTKALYWDNCDPYHYVRTQPMDDHDLLIVGGEDHKTGQADNFEERFDCLENWTRKRFPVVQAVEYKWSGQVLEPSDALAYIGRNPGDEPNVYIATGDSGHGMTHGTIAGILIPDLIAGRENPWSQIYDPSRKPTRAPGEYVMENLNVAAQYRDWLTPGEVKSLDEIPSDAGAVMRRGLSKVAVYRDPQGNVHECSAVCTHMQCIVNWNWAEKSWDCPCHGSRFAPTGKVLNGPAIFDLKKLDEEPEQAARVPAEEKPGAAADDSTWRREQEADRTKAPSRDDAAK